MLISHDPFRCFMPYEPIPVTNADSGPLSGLTLAVKDIYDVAGYRTGSGCPLRLAQSPVASVTAPAVHRLLDAGARFVGKTHTDELAWSMYGMNAHFGTPVNPAAPDRIPGGSSSGSAVAVAGGLADIAIGSDTGGSVRAPASFCGIWGLRPTHGRVSLEAVQPLAPSYDSAGFFARDGQTLGRVAQALIGPDTVSLPQTPILLRPMDMASQLAPESRVIYEAVFGPFTAREVTVFPGGVEAAYHTFLTTMGWDAKAAIIPWIRASAMPLVHGIDGRVASAEQISAADFATANTARAAYATHMQTLLGTTGVLLAPTVPTAPFRLDAPVEVFDSYRHDAMRLLCVAGLAGLPQVTFPAGWIDGAPYGLSLIGPRGSDVSLIALAEKLSKEVPS
ncbi:amidase [Puniceibacterium sediminis]|uniref:Amidase n=1 Tax=Puniceibacterium sediminis TaxID=1608407 RepID=A0A238URC9_9RHOB|nr:amidase [Puniceibacterium sediminis]SNR24700.1 amidase [Puniceibacterium sediminis]